MSEKFSRMDRIAAISEIAASEVSLPFNRRFGDAVKVALVDAPTVGLTTREPSPSSEPSPEPSKVVDEALSVAVAPEVPPSPVPETTSEEEDGRSTSPVSVEALSDAGALVDYESLSRKDLYALCKQRNLVVAKNASEKTMIEALRGGA